MKRWYVVYTRHCMERMAEGHLANQGFETYLPQHRKQRRHARKIDSVLVPLFPSYLFVAFDADVDQWRAINGTHGVSYLITNGSRPAAVPPGVVEEIRQREDAEGLVQVEEAPPFDAGDVVEITHGMLASQTGLFKCGNDNDRITVLLNLLGRETEVQVPAKAVRAFA